MSIQDMDESNRQPLGDIQVPEDDTGVQPTEQDREWETRAIQMGWAPKEQWRGDPNKWISARDFVERALDTPNILRERLDSMGQRLDSTAEENKELRTQLGEAKEVLVQLRDWARNAGEREYNRAKRELEQRQREAVSNADVAAHDSATREIQALEEGREQEPLRKEAAAPNREESRREEPRRESPQRPPENADMSQWVRDNSWWFQDANDPRMRMDAIALYGSFEQTNPNQSVRDRLGDVLKKIKILYPDRFRNQRRDDAAPVHEPAAPAPRQRRSGKGLTYEDLPAEEKAQCDRFVRTIPKYTKEEYVAEYARQQEGRQAQLRDAGIIQ